MRPLRCADFRHSLRDITSENEQENRRRIAEMEKDIMDVEELHGLLLHSEILHSVTHCVASRTGVHSHQAFQC